MDTELVISIAGQGNLDREVVGGKAWSLDRMAHLGLPVPPAFVIPTQNCARYFDAGRTISEELWSTVVSAVDRLAENANKSFGSGPAPLLLSVRSGAAHSMPGMLDTVLNVGMTEGTHRGIAASAGAEFAADTRRRFVDTYRAVVLGGRDAPVPTDAGAQLRGAIAAVFESWVSPRAVAYRRERGLPNTPATAVVVQAMVFGNLDERSGSGVVFSANPVTGAPGLFGEWVRTGQGEDVVSGTVTPAKVDTLATAMPEVFADLTAAAELLDRDAGGIQDIEFTIEAGRLWLLQCRPAKVHIGQSEQDTVEARVLASGEPASPGTATGVVVLDPDEARERAGRGERVVLARATTSPADVHGMIAASAVVTETGGATSHAAVVSRELGRPCVVGCGQGTVTALAGELVTVDGGRGRVLAG